jgi:hypothetical protein
MSPLKRKALFRRLSSESMKKIRLDPTPEPADSTIAVYHERTQALMPKDRDKLHIQMPFDQDLLHIRDLQVIYENRYILPKYTDLCFQALKPRMALLEDELSGVYGELSGVRERLSGVREELSGVRGELDNMLENRLRMLIANALIDLARKVAKTYKPELNNDQSTARLQQFAANVTDTQLENTEIPRKFWGVLRKLDKVPRSIFFSILC